MGLFRSKREQPLSQQRSSRPFGAGHQLRSAHSATRCLTTLDEILSRQPPRSRFTYMPRYVPGNHTWLSPTAPPSQSVCCYDDQGQFLLVALWPSGDVTELGLFVLGSDRRPLTTSIINHWRRLDGSMSSTGLIPAGSIDLLPPKIAVDYVEDIVRTTGFPPTVSNISAVRDMMRENLLVGAHLLISKRDRRHADVFVASHQTSVDFEQIVDDLAAWNPDVLPYIQELPWRARAVALEPEIVQRSPAWTALDR